MASRLALHSDSMFQINNLVLVDDFQQRPDLEGSLGKIRRAFFNGDGRPTRLMVRLFGLDDEIEFDRESLRPINLLVDREVQPRQNDLVRMIQSPYRFCIWGQVVEILDDGMVRVVWFEPLIMMDTEVHQDKLEVLTLNLDGDYQSFQREY